MTQDLTPIRAAVVGTGFISDYHLEVLAATPGVELAAVCDLDYSKALATAEKWKIKTIARSVEELSAETIDIAHVLAPPSAHSSIAGELLRSGIGVFVEKPLTLSAVTSWELCELAAEHGAPLGVNHNNLFHPAFRRLVSEAIGGRLGTIRHVRVSWSIPLAQLESRLYQHWVFQSPQNVIYEQGPHPFSLVHALVGRVRDSTTTILGSLNLDSGSAFHHRWAVTAIAERGSAEVYFDFGPGHPKCSIEVICTDGIAEVNLSRNIVVTETKAPFPDFWSDFLASRERWRSGKRQSLRNLFDYVRFTGGLGPRKDPFFLGMRGSIQAFYSALREGADIPVSGVHGSEVLEWCDSATRDLSSSPKPGLAVPQESAARKGEVVVLGGTGFIGRRVVDKLLQREIPVTIVSRNPEAVSAVMESAIADGRIRMVPGSLESHQSLDAALLGASAVIHLATGNSSTWEDVDRTVIGAAARVGELCLRHEVERLIYVSSIAALYLGPDRGDVEIQDDWNTDPKADERDFYSRGKIGAEQALRRLNEEQGLRVTVVRPGVVLGAETPMQHSGMGFWVQDNRCIGWGLGNSPLPLVWVDDVAEALVQVAIRRGPELDGRAFNLCTQVPLSAADVVNELAGISGRRLEFHPRSLWLSQLIEIGKWVVKKMAGRRSAKFPSFRDLKSRALTPTFSSQLARTALDWSPIEDRSLFVETVLEPCAKSLRTASPDSNAPED